MGQDQSSVFDLAAVAAASNGGNNDPLLPPARYIGAPQKPSKMPYNKYVAYDKQVPFDYPERTWPGKRLQRAPRWCSVDLRDGNQALVNPMDSERKLRFWNLLVSMGFKEIEVGFPSASETDYDFIRMLIERELIPDDVTIVVLTQAREHLIRKTYECLKGAKRAIVHFYNSVSVLQREVVFRKDKAGIKKLATDAATLCKELEGEAKGIDLYYEYSPESFTGTEPEYAVEVCNAVIDVIKPTPEHPMIINLPATVEMTTPNVFADEVEYVSNHLVPRDAVVLSLHPHNDEGMGVAATELAVLAGADRVELYTKPYADNYEIDREAAVAPFVEASQAAHNCRLGVNAGHDLNLRNLSFFHSMMPYLDEVSIGHAIISEALYDGIATVIKRYRDCLA